MSTNEDELILRNLLTLLRRVETEVTSDPPESPSLTPSSPSPPTPPIPLSDILTMMGSMMMMCQTTLETVTSMFQAERAETRQLVLDILQGRQVPLIGLTETTSMSSGESLNFDYEQTPLPSGIEAVLERENQETQEFQELQHSMRQRQALLERMAESQAELDQSSASETSSVGPWTTSQGNG